ncbi:drug resistance transporter, Bcr/CflA subfamily protein [Mycolicibacterium hassiacum DSM 44199]|uniref:Drug resistance transporter, Bcr/CflA subfamily protein n=2 Tax=Mycolicibacterium hassiacum TaxID=46351 RepID=K5BEB3_MYCHD|nr:MFS transporter [Mycolicibacterium hassiacum]EKF22837.1 drug resistance transporter, Bcr/CflA subfamily protein [Mycolicibacterium hassiacum DSM 44199]MDA4084079.1 transporter [Mycolicibacterium hassiacum DSM 44199]VCT91089.1 Bicyclomycin resistance protein [Mycolicibacterium hassiacum DSM 44199]
MIVVLGLMVALGPLTIDMYLPALPNIGDDLGVSSAVAQLTLTGTLLGLGLGQLIVGPLSDALGRRRPLMAGIVLHMLASLLCMFAPNIEVLGVARCLQGMGAAAASVVAVAVVGDLFAESVAATVMSRLILVLGAAPVIAPSLGAAVLLAASWRWVFAALLVLVGALAMSGLFAYIAVAPYVLQGRYGLGQQTFALLFAAGAIALIGATQYNVVLLRRFAPQQIARAALVAAALAASAFLVVTMAGVGGLAGFVVPVWVVLLAMGLVLPNTPAVALSRHPEASGTAAALLGAAQFATGAAIAPLVGVLGNDELALAQVMTVGMVVALLALLAVGVSAAENTSATDDVGADTVPEPA